MNFKDKLKKYKSIFDEYLEEYLSSVSFDLPTYEESFKYSLNIGGKRIRPILLMAVNEMFGGTFEDVKNLCVAVEMIHTYSLIHDDLPSMDNDDFRRGKPTNHKVFGEAQAILAGDALLSAGFNILLKEALKGERYLKAALIMGEGCGEKGMVQGQAADLYFENREVSLSDLRFIDKNKTGRLLTAPMCMACALHGDRYIKEFERFGEIFGELFQLTDDILDVTGSFEKLGKSIGKDEKSAKLTYVRINGLEESRKYCDKLKNQLEEILSSIDLDTTFLSELITFTIERDN